MRAIAWWRTYAEETAERLFDQDFLMTPPALKVSQTPRPCPALGLLQTSFSTLFLAFPQQADGTPIKSSALTCQFSLENRQDGVEQLCAGARYPPLVLSPFLPFKLRQLRSISGMSTRRRSARLATASMP